MFTSFVIYMCLGVGLQFHSLVFFSMAPHCAALYGLLLVLALANISLSSCQLVKGSVSCLDCRPHKDLSGMRVAVKCKNERKLMYAVTNRKGYFEVKIPENSSLPSSPSTNCFVMLLGGPVQLWAFKKSMVSKIVKATGLKDSYGLSTHLTFFTSYMSKAHHRPNAGAKAPQFGVSAAPNGFPSMGGMGFPPPGNWTSTLPLIFYFPFLPIIGIP